VVFDSCFAGAAAVHASGPASGALLRHVAAPGAVLQVFGCEVMVVVPGAATPNTPWFLPLMIHLHMLSSLCMFIAGVPSSCRDPFQQENHPMAMGVLYHMIAASRLLHAATACCRPAACPRGSTQHPSLGEQYR
jgi:hypothetical protein